MTPRGRQRKENALEVLSKPQIRRFWGIANGRDRILILLGMETASRVNEMEYFTVPGIDWENGTIKKYDIKKKEYKKVGISPRLLEDLRRYIATMHIKEKLFDIKWQQMNKILRGYCESFEFDGWVSWHVLRRTYVSQAESAGISLEEVLYVTGDRPSTVARYYKKVSPADLGAKVNRLYEEEA